MKSRVTLIIAAVVIAALAILAYGVVQMMVQKSPRLIVGDRVIQLEIVRTDEERAAGLSGRMSLPADQGMLFVFDDPGAYAFWMKGMLFPIDILWIRDGVIVDIVTLQPPAATGAIPQHTPTSQADQVLEMNAGEAKKLGLKVGSRVTIER